MLNSAFAWSTVAWIWIVGSIFGGFALSAAIARAGKKIAAASVPLWLFAPVALASTSPGGQLSWIDTGIILAFAALLAAVTWGYTRGCEP